MAKWKVIEGGYVFFDAVNNPHEGGAILDDANPDVAKVIEGQKHKLEIIADAPAAAPAAKAEPAPTEQPKPQEAAKSTEQPPEPAGPEKPPAQPAPEVVKKEKEVKANAGGQPAADRVPAGAQPAADAKPAAGEESRSL